MWQNPVQREVTPAWYLFWALGPRPQLTSARKPSRLCPCVCVPGCVVTIISVSFPKSCWPHPDRISLTTRMVHAASSSIHWSLEPRHFSENSSLPKDISSQILRVCHLSSFEGLPPCPPPLSLPLCLSPYLPPYSCARHRAGPWGTRDVKDTISAHQSHLGDRRDQRQSQCLW